MRTRGIALGAVVAGLVALAGASEASALTCGQDVKKDIKLRQNLNCAASGTDGLVVAKNGVEIDLNGRKIIGPAGSYSGIDASGYDRVTVRNGTLQGWNNGIYTYNVSRLKLLKLKISLGGATDDYGLNVNYSLHPLIKNVTVSNALYGAYLYDALGLKVVNLKVTDSDDTETYGINGAYLQGVVKELQANGAYYGLYTYGETPGLTVRDSVTNGTGYAGLYISNSTPLSGYRYTLIDNKALNSNDYGFYASYDVDGGGNKATGAGPNNCYNVPCGG